METEVSRKKKTDRPRFRTKLRNILIRFNKKTIRLAEHPYTIALQKEDKAEYERAVASSAHQKKKKHGWRQFLELKKSLESKGYVPANEPIVLKWDGRHWYVSRGRHRMCLLWNLYGKTAKLVITISKKKAEVWEVRTLK